MAENVYIITCVNCNLSGFVRIFGVSSFTPSRMHAPPPLKTREQVTSTAKFTSYKHSRNQLEIKF